MKKLALAAAALAVMSTAAAAQGYRTTSTIDKRQAIQEHRIQQGIRSGQLTRSEAHKLEREQAYIRQLERKALRDGHIDRREAKTIASAQNRANRHIYAEKHDAQVRGRVAWQKPGLWYRRWW